MRVALISKGSSLHATLPNIGPVDTTIAINDALGVYRADWLVMMDMNKLHERYAHLASMFDISPKVGVYTAECYLPLAKEMFPGLLYEGTDQIRRIGVHNIPNSFIAGMFFAQQVLHATEIEVHGVDLGGANINNSVEVDGRYASRWEDEKRITRSVFKAIRDEGVKITCHGLFKA